MKPERLRNKIQGPRPAEGKALASCAGPHTSTSRGNFLRGVREAKPWCVFVELGWGVSSWPREIWEWRVTATLC